MFGVAYCISFFQATILRIIMSLAGVLSGPTLGVFTLGIFFPWSNAKVKRDFHYTAIPNGF